MPTPVAFLCHSSEDKAVAERIARGLIAQGVETFFDKWSISPGDSLRRAIERGIEGATHFVALVSPRSLISEWVQTEFDGALVRKIEGRCRLIPLFLDIDPKDTPLTLRSLRGIRVKDIDAAIRETSNACHGILEKPELGPAPAVVRLPGVRLSPLAVRVALHLGSLSPHGGCGEPQLSYQDIMGAMKSTIDEIDEAIDELEEHFLVHIDKVMGGREGWIISPKEPLFWDVDPVLIGNRPAEDAVVVAGLLANSEPGGMECRFLADALGWTSRRLNPAATYLVKYGLADGSETSGSYPFEYSYIAATSKTRRFVRENQLPRQ